MDRVLSSPLLAFCLAALANLRAAVPGLVPLPLPGGETWLPAITRRPTQAYGGRTMLEVIADGEERWLLEDVERSFDYATTA